MPDFLKPHFFCPLFRLVLQKNEATTSLYLNETAADTPVQKHEDRYQKCGITMSDRFAYVVSNILNPEITVTVLLINEIYRIQQILSSNYPSAASDVVE